MALILMGAGALLVVLAFLRWFADADAASLARATQRAGQWLMGGLAVLTALRGQFVPAVVILLVAAGWYLVQAGRAARRQRQWPGENPTDVPEPPYAPGPMSRGQALDILGLSEGADADAVREAHRRLIQKNHPDHGGSSYLAAQINAAKDLLLK